MELLEVIQKISQSASQGMGMTDLTIGTVESVSPLTITTQTSMQVLREEVLYLTAAVIEKKISFLGHTHTTLDGTTSEALTSVVCTENGQALPFDSGGVIINRGLQAGDKVLLLRVQRGQMFIVLSRVYDSEGGS